MKSSGHISCRLAQMWDLPVLFFVCGVGKGMIPFYSTITWFYTVGCQ